MEKLTESLIRILVYAIHIVDQANESVYAAHEHWSRRTAEDWLRGRVYRDYQQLWVPEDVPENRALWFVLAIWEETEEGGFTTLPIFYSEDHQISETQVDSTRVRHPH